MIQFCKPDIYHCHREILGLRLTRCMEVRYKVGHERESSFSSMYRGWVIWR
jgi:hypothetical protein